MAAGKQRALIVGQIPDAPLSWDPEAQSRWTELKRFLDDMQVRMHSGVVGYDYVIAGSVPTTTSLDVATPNLAEVTRTLAKLLNDLADAGIIDARNV